MTIKGWFLLRRSPRTLLASVEEQWSFLSDFAQTCGREHFTVQQLGDIPAFLDEKVTVRNLLKIFGAFLADFPA